MSHESIFFKKLVWNSLLQFYWPKNQFIGQDKLNETQIFQLLNKVAVK